MLSHSERCMQKKNLTSEYYDIHDPFIDDSELALDERTYFAQTKQQGFYVSSGEVALMKDKCVLPGPCSNSCLYIRITERRKSLNQNESDLQRKGKQLRMRLARVHPRKKGRKTPQ